MTGVEFVCRPRAHPRHVSLNRLCGCQERRTGNQRSHTPTAISRNLYRKMHWSAVRKAVSLYERNQQLRNDVTSLKRNCRSAATQGIELSRDTTIGSNEDDIIPSQPRYHEQELA